jgi:hypothetical protein
MFVAEDRGDYKGCAVRRGIIRFMWKRGRRAFSIANILIVLTALAHTLGNLMSGSSGAAEDKVVAEMANFHVGLGLNMNPSIYDIYRALVFIMSVTFVALGVVSLVLSASRDVSDRVLRRITWIYFAWVGAFLVLNAVYRIPPSLISGALIELALLVSLFWPGANSDKIWAKDSPNAKT